MILLKQCSLVLIGLAGGLAVGAGLVAFLTVLDIIPRLAQMTKTFTYVHAYQWAIISGSVLWTWLGLHEMRIALPIDLTMVYGTFAGMFVGLLAAALTEVLNVLPILAKRIGMAERMLWLLAAMILGKVLGSLFQWVFFSPFS